MRVSIKRIQVSFSYVPGKLLLWGTEWGNDLTHMLRFRIFALSQHMFRTLVRAISLKYQCFFSEFPGIRRLPTNSRSQESRSPKKEKGKWKKRGRGKAFLLLFSYFWRIDSPEWSRDSPGECHPCGDEHQPLSGGRQGPDWDEQFLDQLDYFWGTLFLIQRWER